MPPRKPPLESKVQAGIRKDILKRLPGSLVTKTDSSQYQGMPDLLVIWEDQWAILEVKRSAPTSSDYQPNQEWYIDKLNEMSFSSVIYPENQEEVLNELQQTFEARRASRNTKR